MAHMPEKDPGLWAALITWVIAHQPQLYAAGLSVAIAVFRVMYGGGNRRQMLLEGALCGLITLALVPLLEWMGLPQGMATFAGGAVGFMGVEKLRSYSDLFLSRKAQG
ncbi:phage holin, lambda family [Pseudomonas sp. URIL14HWK12:I8]|uniref:phage holin, lambda family n=1 Tax=unclassified Pseudomonas TaxID=196821 RepID=UPI000410EAF9|nr:MULTISPECIES: phage holin, lambda family [unclassified Pseudomonas]SNB84574.1 phage holin, lambda family [Pseudomonas sp. URIL14HWK12:I8]